MKLLSISLDKKILAENSENFQRQKEYAQLVDELHIIVFGPEKEIKSDNLFIYGSGGSNKISLFLRTYKVAKKKLKNKDLKDWIITTQDPFESALIGWLLSKKFKVGLNIQEHGDYFSEKYWRNENLLNFLRYYLGKFLIKRADSVRAVSQRIKNTLVSRINIDKNKIVIVPVYTKKIQNVTDLPTKQEFKAQNDNTKFKNNKFVFLTMGRLVKQKNLILLIRAFREVVKDFKQMALFIIGKGSEKKKLINLVKKLDLEDNVKFIEWTDDVYSYYNLANVYVLSSNYEGWGRVIIEAASCGLPIIMTDVGCAGEVIKNEKNGLMVPLDDKKKLAEAMLRLIKNKDLRIKFGIEAKKAIKNLLSKQKTLRLYKKSWEKASSRKL